jgi:hypothetical protein
MSNNNNSKSGVAALAVNLAAGTQKYLSTANAILVDGGTFTAAQVIAQLNALADLRKAVDAANAVLKGKRMDESAKAPSLRAFMDAYEGFVRSAFGNQPEVLADFGLAPRKVRAPLTAEKLAAAKAKRAATRKARGTIGKKKILAVKGNVTGVIVTPVTLATTEPPPANAATTAVNGSASNGAAAKTA